MKHLLALAAIAAASFTWTDPAAAFHLSPAGTRFSATGTIGLAQGSVGYTCTMTARGKTTARGKGKFISAGLSGADPHCAGTTATGLPWKIKATGPSGVTVSNVGFTGAVGVCGPSPAGMQVNSGMWSFDDLLAPQCIFSGGLNTSPAINIVP